jgi:hypothetical protein
MVPAACECGEQLFAHTTLISLHNVYSQLGHDDSCKDQLNQFDRSSHAPLGHSESWRTEPGGWRTVRSCLQQFIFILGLPRDKLPGSSLFCFESELMSGRGGSHAASKPAASTGQKTAPKPPIQTPAKGKVRKRTFLDFLIQVI